jgi:hypothetical protein
VDEGWVFYPCLALWWRKQFGEHETYHFYHYLHITLDKKLLKSKDTLGQGVSLKFPIENVGFILKDKVMKKIQKLLTTFENICLKSRTG